MYVLVFQINYKSKLRPRAPRPPTAHATGGDLLPPTLQDRRPGRDKDRRAAEDTAARLAPVPVRTHNLIMSGVADYARGRPPVARAPAAPLPALVATTAGTTATEPAAADAPRRPATAPPQPPEPPTPHAPRRHRHVRHPRADPGRRHRQRHRRHRRATEWPVPLEGCPPPREQGAHAQSSPEILRLLESKRKAAPERHTRYITRSRREAGGCSA